MKKVISILLTAALLLTLVTLPAMAEAPKKLIWWTISSGDAPLDAKEVIDKANEISAEKIGITIDLKFKTADQLQLDLETGEYYDMIFSCDWANNYDLHARDGYYYDITDLAKEETPALYEAVDPWWTPAIVNDRIYGIPALKDLGAQVFFRLDSDFAASKGIEIPDEMAFGDIEPLLAAWKADHPNEYPLHMTKNGLTGFWQVHQRIVSTYLVIPYRFADDPEKATKIIPIWEDEEYMNMLRLLHKWYEMGYINPDAATTEDLPFDLRTPVRSGTAWTGYKGWSNPATYGFNVKLSQYIGPYMSRATMQGALHAINAGASRENAVACLKYMELLYTDTSFRDILAYGIEGKHFKYLDNGTVLRLPAGTEGYNFDTYCTGPVISASVMSASEDILGDADQWEKVYKNYEKAKVSATGGFSFNGESTTDLRTALYAIYSSYNAELVTGTVDPDVAMKEIADQMYAIGLQDVLDEAQRQLDEYLAK